MMIKKYAKEVRVDENTMDMVFGYEVNGNYELKVIKPEEQEDFFNELNRVRDTIDMMLDFILRVKMARHEGAKLSDFLKNEAN